MEDHSLAELIRRQHDNSLDARTLLEVCLKRVDEANHSGPEFGAVLEINLDAHSIAGDLDAYRKRGEPLGSLHGLPILLKDNIATDGALHTSAGSLALAELLTERDAFVVQRLREAGAVILGKANMTEFANFMSLGMPPGYSSRGGQVQNPYGRGFHPGGSSAGSAVAVAAGMAVAALGTETSGSILSPASQNSLVGVKPTTGLVSRTGILPISHSQDTAGPIARSVEDAARVLSVLVGSDPEDPLTGAADTHRCDYAAGLRTGGLRGARVGVPRRFYYQGLPADELAVMERAFGELRDLGAAVVDPADIDTAEDLRRYYFEVMLREFKPGLNTFLKGTPEGPWPHSLPEVIAFNDAHPEATLVFGQILLLAAEATPGDLKEEAYRFARARDLRLAGELGLDATLGRHALDVLVLMGSHGAELGAKAGYPSVTVPAGYTKAGQPVGLTFVGRAFSEAVLLELAYDYEQATHHRRSPLLG